MANIQPLFPTAASPALFAPLFAAGAQPFAAARWPATQTVIEDPIAAAREQAESILAQARAQGGELVAVAVQQAAQAARQEQLAAFEQASGELLAALQDGWQAAQEELERQAVGLLADLLGRLVHQHFEADDQAIVPLVREALQHLGASARVQVVVAPQHEAALRQAYLDLAATLREEARLELVVSDAAEPCGCVLHGDDGSVDARLATRMANIEQAIAETVLGQVAT